MLLTCSRITGKCNTGTGGLAHVAECHHLYVDSSAPGIGNIIVTAVYISSRVVPGTEHGFDCFHQLLLRVSREISADFLFVLCLELLCQLFQVLCCQLNVLGHALGFFHLVDQLFEVLFAYLHNHIGEHLDKSSVAVPSPAGIPGLLGQNLNNLFI